MLFAQAIELQIPDELQKAMRDNPDAAALLIDRLFWLSMSVLGIGAVAMLSLSRLLEAGWIPKHEAPRLFVGIFICTLTAFILVAGYSQAQYAWLMAFFGALIGYYFRESYREQPPPPAA